MLNSFLMGWPADMRILCGLALASAIALAQGPSPSAPLVSPQRPGTSNVLPTNTGSPATATVPRGYILGTGDIVTVHVTELDEFNGRTFRVDNDGTINLPFVGRIHVGGLTLTELETNVTAALRQQVKNPTVMASLTEAKSQPVAVVGYVNVPGIYQLQGGKRLLDVLSLAGGIKPEAGYILKLSRKRAQGPIPLDNSVEDPSHNAYTAQINVTELMEGRDPRLNVTLMPDDTITLPKAELIYVLGDVRKAGGFAVSQTRGLSVLHAISLAEGFGPNAAPKSARILRYVDGRPEREQIPVDLKKLLAGKSKDVPLNPDDILYVPNSAAKKMTARAAEMALQTVSGLLIWRGPF